MDVMFDIDYLFKIIHNLEKKVEYVDIRTGQSNTSSIMMKDGKIKEIISGFNQGGTIRVLNNGAWGFAHTNDLTKLAEVGDYAFKLSQSLESDVELNKAEPIVDNVKTNAKIPINDISTEDKKEVLKEVNNATTLDKIVSTTLSYVDSDVSKLFINSEGSCISSEESTVALSVNAVASEGESIQFSHGSLGGVKGFEVINDEDLEKFGRNIGEKAVRLLSASKAPSGKFQIVTDSELTGVFIHEALGHASEADLILQNDSVLKGKLGSKIGSNLVTIIDDPSMDAFGHYDYDAEGTKTKENILVENGVLQSLLTSRETASKLGLKYSSGNARSGISQQPIVRMSNTYLKPGNSSFEELLEDIKEGIYLKGSRGGQVDTGKGIFQFNAVESFKIENGEITTPLRDVSLSGNILETLNNVSDVGSDFKMSVGFCGKSGQTVPVGDGGPHIKIINAMVGGAM